MYDYVMLTSDVRIAGGRYAHLPYVMHAARYRTIDAVAVLVGHG